MVWFVSLKKVCTAAVLGVALVSSHPIAAQETALVSANGKPVVFGVARGFKRKAGLCLDYGKSRLRNGAPYHVVEPARTITRHEGMDFCRRAGTPVIAPLNGKIRFIEQDNASWGGVVGITSNFSMRPSPGKSKQRIFVEMVHIVPIQGLRKGQKVSAGQLVGHVQKANRPSIGDTPHVHFAVRRCNDWPTCHIDPNYFWRDGLGRISCHAPSKPLPNGRMVAPLPCK
ncbi:M23 family metallopeptidase [Shimia sp. MIT1388]|uniref:M23 family metallopeptidase n=1 Tax=Shimia sp. MIT1388 TaxID=3096992 RepID=UPI00399C474B